MKQRFVTAFVLIAVMLPLVLLGGIYLDILILAITLGYTYELIELFGQKYHLVSKICFFIVTLLCNSCACLWPQWLFASIILTLLLINSLPIFDTEVQFNECCVFYMISILLTLTIKSFVEIRNTSLGLLFFVLIATFVTDAFALFVGKAFGKHKLCARISPNKTIEGSVGAYILTCLLLIIYSYICFGALNTQLWLMCFIMPCSGQIGDLVFSCVKRHYQVKDFGNIFPGHGGILDRFDSITFNCLIYLLITVVLG